MNEQENALQEIKQDLARVKTLLEELPKSIDLKLNLFEEKLKVANHRIEDLENTNTWMWRAIVGAIVAGIVAMYFS